MISVIVPVYNAEKYLRRCVDSILTSTCSDFEILLINDGSTDNSPRICEDCAAQDGRIALIHQHNQGVSAARNRGIDACRGDWVVFVDADDCISPDFLEMIAQADCQGLDMLQFDFSRHPNFVVSSHHDATDTSLSCPTGHSSPDAAASCLTLSFQGDQMQQLIHRILVPCQLLPEGNTDFRSPCLRAYRRTILYQHGIRFAPHLAVGEDLLFNLEYHLKAGSCVYIPRPLCYYDVHTGSATHGFRTGLVENHARLQEDVKDILLANNCYSLFEEDFYSYCLENLAYVLIREIFHPHSTRTRRERRTLCRSLHQNQTYRQALKYNFHLGILPRKILLLCFRLHLTLLTCLISRVSYHYLERRHT